MRVTGGPRTHIAFYLQGPGVVLHFQLGVLKSASHPAFMALYARSVRQELLLVLSELGWEKELCLSVP